MQLSQRWGLGQHPPPPAPCELQDALVHRGPAAAGQAWEGLFKVVDEDKTLPRGRRCGPRCLSWEAAPECTLLRFPRVERVAMSSGTWRWNDRMIESRPLRQQAAQDPCPLLMIHTGACGKGRSGREHQWDQQADRFCVTQVRPQPPGGAISWGIK